MLRPEPAGGANSAPPDLRVGFWGTKGKGSEREKEKGIKGREGGGRENETKDEKGRGREREDLCAVVIFLGKTLLGKSTDFSVQSLLHRSAVRQTHARHVRPKNGKLKETKQSQTADSAPGVASWRVTTCKRYYPVALYTRTLGLCANTMS